MCHQELEESSFGYNFFGQKALPALYLSTWILINLNLSSGKSEGRRSGSGEANWSGGRRGRRRWRRRSSGGNLQGDPSGRVLAFVYINMDIVRDFVLWVYSLFSDGTSVFQKNASYQPDWTPCMYVDHKCSNASKLSSFNSQQKWVYRVLPLYFIPFDS